jgi:alpha-1,2-mannosyltransferase
LYLASIAVVVIELRIPFAWPALFPASILLLGNPVLNQHYQGQLNCLLASLITAAWVADRRGRPALAGLVVGLAGAVKLYPLYLLTYFVFTRRWSGLVAGVIAFLAANGLACTLFGVGAFQDYVFQVLPAIAGQFETSWVNLSLHGFWLRLMESELIRTWFGTDTAPLVGRVLAWVAAAIVTLFVAWSCRIPRTRDSLDRSFALAVVAMLLVSPITWSHYSLLLVMPLGLAMMRVSTGLGTWSLVAILAVLWLPPSFAAQTWLGQAGAQSTSALANAQVSTSVNLALISVPHYGLLGLFVLILPVREIHLIRSGPVEPPRDCS